MPNIPEKIGKYQIRKLIGKGAMGLVYEGFDPHIERRVAVKTLRRALISSADNKDEYLRRFQREAKAAAKCIHPNIVLVLEYGEYDDTPFIVMEFIEGQPLSKIISSGEKLPLPHVSFIISQILKGLNAAHAQGVIHRDIKPSNVIIMDRGKAKLTDFGIARVENNPELTQVGIVMGTPQYMAPEQSLGRPVDQRADIFSVTLIIADLFAQAEYDNAVSLSTMPKIDGLPLGNRLNRRSFTVPTVLIPVFQKGLSIKAKERYKSVVQLAQAIKAQLPRLQSGIDEQVDQPTQVIEQPTQVIKQAITCNITADQDLKTELTAGTGLFDLNSNLGTLGSQPTLVTAMDHAMLKRLESDLRQYIGETAAEKIRQESKNAISMAEIINSLAREIPKKKHRQKFIDRWIQ